jgi:hypothetical protein
MKSGKLSYTKSETGERCVDVAELERVFGLKPVPNGAADTAPLQSDATQPPEVAILRELVERQDATIADLRATIRAITDEKRTLLALLTGPTRIPWWRRVFRR